MSIPSMAFSITRVEQSLVAQNQDNVTVIYWVMVPEAQCPVRKELGLPMRQHYEVSMNAHCHKRVCLLLFSILATSKIISGRVLTCDCEHSWHFYSAAPQEDQATSTLT